VLEWVGYPLGVVKGIAGQTRLKVTYSKLINFMFNLGEGYLKPKWTEFYRLL
jgi:hypothetical protein